MYKNPQEKIGKRLKALYESRGLPGAKFLRQVWDKSEGIYKPIAESTLSDVVNGKVYPSAQLLVAVDRAYFANPDKLLFDENRLPVYRIEKAVGKLTWKKFLDFLDVCLLVMEKTPYDSVAVSEADRVTLSTKCIKSESEAAKRKRLRKSNMSDCALRLEEIRKTSDYTQAELASKFSLGKNTITAYEWDNDLPDTEYLINLCLATGASAAYILDAYNSLPMHLLIIQSLLADYCYKTQIALVKKFAEVLGKYF